MDAPLLDNMEGSDLVAKAQARTKAGPLQSDPYSPAQTPSQTPQITPESALFALNKDELRAHPDFYTLFVRDRNTTISSAVFNLVSTIIGGGVLSLPYAMRKCGLIVGMLMLVLASITTDWSVYILISCSRRSGAQSYKEVATRAFGPWCGVLVTALIFVLTLLVCVAYCVLVRDIINPLRDFAGAKDWGGDNTVMVIAIALTTPLSLSRGLGALRFTSAVCLGAVLVLAMCLLYHAAKAHATGKFPPGSPGDHSIAWLPSSAMDCAYSFPLFAVAFMCHFNVLPIHGDLIVPSRTRIKRLIHSTILLCALVYLLTGLCGYFVFFDATEDNVLKNYPDDDPTMTVGRIGLLVSIVLSFPLLVLPCRDCMHELIVLALSLCCGRSAPRRSLVYVKESNVLMGDDDAANQPYHAQEGESAPDSPKSSDSGTAPYHPTNSLHRFFRDHFVRVVETLVVMVAAIATGCSVKSVVVVWSYLGSTVGISIAYILPPLFYLRIRRPDFGSSMVVPAYTLLAFGIVSCVVCTAMAVMTN